MFEKQPSNTLQRSFFTPVLPLVLEIPASIKKLLNNYGYDIFQFNKELHKKYDDDLAKIHEEEFDYQPDIDYWDKTNEGKYRFCLVITSHDEAIGYVRLYVNQENQQKYFWLRHIAVKNSEKQKGIGSMLLAVVMHNVNKMQAKIPHKSFMYVNSKLIPATERFYSSKHGGGFIEEEEGSDLNKHSYNYKASLPFAGEIISQRIKAFRPDPERVMITNVLRKFMGNQMLDSQFYNYAKSILPFCGNNEEDLEKYLHEMLGFPYQCKMDLS